MILRAGRFLLATALLLPGSAWSQTQPTAGSTFAGPWHTAERLRPAVQSGGAGRGDSVELARAELELGRAAEAYALLGGMTTAPPLLAAAAYQTGDYEIAAELFQRAAAEATGLRRGVFAARAARANELAGHGTAAASLYEIAADELSPIEPWLTIRWARVTEDRRRALEAVRSAPPEVRRFAADARALLLLLSGDTLAAAAALEEAGRADSAARLVLAQGDRTEARRLTFVALQSGDTGSVRGALALAEVDLEPRDRGELRSVARARLRLGQRQEALALMRAAVERGDTTARTLLMLGDLQRDVGNFWDAVRAYGRAVERGGEYGATAQYRRARLLPSLGRSSQGYRELQGFVDDHPEHELAPRAQFLVAERHRRGGRRSVADSLYAFVAERWPTHQYAGRSRLTLARQALRAADREAAMRWYSAEITVGGSQRRVASYLLASLEATMGDTGAARVRWQALAREDSLGYYGTMARAAAGVPDPVFAPAPAHDLTPEARATLERLDLLRASYQHDEAEALVRYEMARRDRPPQELLDLSEGLTVRGWVSEGIRLGWRASSTLTLGDPRTLRAVFPWPLRGLIEAEAAEWSVDPYLIAGLMRQESSFTPDATSRAGAKGLMQLMPATARGLARQLGVEWDESLLVVADANAHLGTAHLTALLRTYDERIAPTLAAYNAGGRPVSRWLRYPEARDQFLWVERIPYVETRGYVRTVLRNRELYRMLYPVGDGGPAASR